MAAGILAGAGVEDVVGDLRAEYQLREGRSFDVLRVELVDEGLHERTGGAHALRARPVPSLLLHGGVGELRPAAAGVPALAVELLLGRAAQDLAAGLPARSGMRQWAAKRVSCRSTAVSPKAQSSAESGSTVDGSPTALGRLPAGCPRRPGPRCPARTPRRRRPGSQRPLRPCGYHRCPRVGLDTRTSIRA
jgi:hypothetical protein